MLIHVLQVHKETVTKVPNAKPGRESTEIEIYGMQGISPDVLAAHYGEEEDDVPSKLAKAEIPSSVTPGSLGVGFPPQSTFGGMRAIIFYVSCSRIFSLLFGTLVFPKIMFLYRTKSYNPASASFWLASSSLSPTLVPSSSSCFSSTCTIGIGTAASISRTEYEASHAAHCSACTSTVFAYRTSRTAPSYSATPIPVSQPLFPVVASNNIPTQSLPFSAPLLSTNIPPSTPAELKSSIDAINNAVMASNYHTPGIQGGKLVNSHSYAFGSNTGGPSIGLPSVIAYKVLAIQPEVYLVWDDEDGGKKNVLAQISGA